MITGSGGLIKEKNNAPEMCTGCEIPYGREDDASMVALSSENEFDTKAFRLIICKIYTRGNDNPIKTIRNRSLKG